MAIPSIFRPLFARLPPAIPMDTPASGVGSPLWWTYRLTHRLAVEQVGTVVQSTDGMLAARVGLAKLDRYYRGQFDLPWVSDKDTEEAYLVLLERARANMMRLVVNAEAERLHMNGLRLPGDDEVADSETWAIWQRNDMEHWAPIAFRDALKLRRSYLSVWWGDDRKARIVAEDPMQCIVENTPGDPRRRAAGLKTWVDDWTGERHANLYLPGGIHYMRWGAAPGGGPEGWYPRADSQPNPLRRVPLVPFVNQPEISGDGVSEIEDLIPLQDSYNQTRANRDIAEHLSAFRQKWATGLDIPEDDDGNPIEPFKAAINKLWIAPGEEGSTAKFGQFDSTDMGQYNENLEQITETISIISRTPRHVFMHQGQAPSGDAMKSDEAGLVAKVKAVWVPFGAGVRETLSLAREIDGLSTPFGSEVVWGDPEWQTYAQLVDGTVKLVQERIVSLDWAREKIGLSPGTITRVRAELLQDEIAASLMEPVPLTQPAGDADPVA